MEAEWTDMIIPEIILNHGQKYLKVRLSGWITLELEKPEIIGFIDNSKILNVDMISKNILYSLIYTG